MNLEKVINLENAHEFQKRPFFNNHVLKILMNLEKCYVMNFEYTHKFRICL